MQQIVNSTQDATGNRGTLTERFCQVLELNLEPSREWLRSLCCAAHVSYYRVTTEPLRSAETVAPRDSDSK